MHELGRLHRGAPQAGIYVRGGLALRQRRIISAYIEEHLNEQIPLALLVQLAGLSQRHFCRFQAIVRRRSAQISRRSSHRARQDHAGDLSAIHHRDRLCGRFQ